MPRYEIRWHGRGGQGTVTAAEMLAEAAIEERKYALAFPEYGAERRGAPVLAFTRIDDAPILEREPILEPNIVVVLDSLLTPDIYLKGLKKDGIVIINTARSPEDVARHIREYGMEPPERIAVVDATNIALKWLNAPIVNTAMLGALVRATGVVSLETISRVVYNRFSPRSSRLAEANVSAVKEAYENVKVAKIG
ncbi:MAG: 2-oxoacid:acceptor oxidoreductase family protein [Pyrodictiaceae archaeon]